MKPRSQSSFATQSNSASTRKAMAQAERLCSARGARLTILRRRVLEIIRASDVPLGAYAILDVLRDEGRAGAPPTVYRALDFLLEQGLVHRIASLNVFTACCSPGDAHGGQFFICACCGHVDEFKSDGVASAIGSEARGAGFEISNQMVEVLGTCPDCKKGQTDDR